MGIVVTTFYLVLKTIPKNNINNWSNDSLFMFKTKGYLKEAFWGGGQALFSALSNNIPLILITTLGGFVDAGLYFLAERFVRLPINLISNNLRNVIISKISSEQANYHNLILKISLGLLCLSLVGTTIAYASSDYFFLTFFGADWLVSSNITKLMLIWVVFNFLSLPFQTYNANYFNIKNLTLIEVIFLTIKVSCIYLAYSFEYGVIGAAAAIALTSSCYSFLHVLIYLINHRKKESKCY
jgi:O-antigen/teichoic acid export membrane protein